MELTTNTTQRLVMALLIATAGLVVLLATGIVAFFWMMSGGMVGMGGIMNGNMMNEMYSACTELMKSFR